MMFTTCVGSDDTSECESKSDALQKVSNSPQLSSEPSCHTCTRLIFYLNLLSALYNQQCGAGVCRLTHSLVALKL